MYLNVQLIIKFQILFLHQRSLFLFLVTGDGGLFPLMKLVKLGKKHYELRYTDLLYGTKKVKSR